MRILVIGKNGFVGKSLFEFLTEKGYKSDIVGSDELNLLDESAVKAFLDRHYYDVIINCAVWSPIKTKDYNDINREVSNDLRMFLNIAKYSHMYGKMLYFGSGAEYDKRFPIVNVSERDFDRAIPVSDYGFAKYAINQYIEKSDNIYNLRIFGLYGKHEDYRCKFITGACAKAVMNIPISIRQNVFFDFLYIDDFCEMVRRFLELGEPKYHSYNIVSGEKVDLISLAKMVVDTAREIDHKEIPVIVCRDGLANEYTASNERLLAEIGPMQMTSTRDAIRTLYSYYRTMEQTIDISALVYQG